MTTSDTGDPAARPGQPLEWSGRPGPIVALIGERRCSLAAVRYAIPLAAGGSWPLLVTAVRRWPPPSVAILSTTGVFVCDTHAEAVERELFAAVAAVLAPSGLSWNFAMLLGGMAPESVLAEPLRRDAQIVMVRHRHRWPSVPRVPLDRMLWLGRTARPPVLVACDHHAMR